MSAPDPSERFVVMAAAAIEGEEETATYGYYGGSWRIDMDHAPDVAREAIRPVLAHLHAEVAARVDDFQAMVGPAQTATHVGYDAGYVDALAWVMDLLAGRAEQ